MKINFTKYQALGNDFLVIEAGKKPLNKKQLKSLALKMCDRRTGVGADGVLYITKSNSANLKADVYNADGGWAEKSGNGLRIIGLHIYRSGIRKSPYMVEMGREIARIWLTKPIKNGFMIKTELGKPDFKTRNVPVKAKSQHVINSTLKIGTVKINATCLSLGNPHTVIMVKDFDFEWKKLGSSIEKASIFPECSNVEFVKVISRKKLHVSDWERGAGATGSSGTGAAAAVCASIVQGFVGRKCEVKFDTGSLYVFWNPKTDIVELTGPAQHVMSGQFEFEK